ncbi:MAG: hypothetical protein ABI218_01210 [Caldimonas sp.]
MVTAISGSSGAGAYGGSVASSGRALNADLARCEVQLSDWSHCVSAKTPQGKEKIAEISARVDDIKARMKAAEQPAPTRADAQAPAGVGPLGHTVDVFA